MTSRQHHIDTIPDLEQRLRIELRRTDAVRELAQVLGATLELRPLLESLLTKVTQLMDAERTSLFLVKTDGGLESWVAQGPGGTQLLPIQLPHGKGIAGWVATSGETVNIPDVYDDPRFDPSNDRRSGFTTRSMLCMPLPDHAGEVMGVIQVLNKRGSPFDTDDEALLRTVAVVAGINIENTRLYTSMLEQNRALVDTQTELKEKLDELDVLYRIETEAADAHDQDQLVERLLDRAAELVGCDDAVALLRDARSGELVCHRRSKPAMRVRIDSGQGVVGWVTEHQVPVLLTSVDGDPRSDRALWQELDCAPLSVLCVPLVGQGEELALGAIELHDKRNGMFDDEDRKLLTLIAGQVARSLLILRAREERARSSRLESVGQLVSGLLHDLKTPMTIASGYTQLMAESSDAAEREEYAQSILKQFDLLGAMTGEVLAFVRGDSKLLVRKVHLNRFAKELREQLTRELESRDVKLTIDARYTGVALFDELKLFRAVHNLARNAAQAMVHGGTFVITIDSANAQLLLTFADNGPGIPAAMRGRLFTPFSTSGKRDGTGLGLAIVKKIVDEHGGTIDCDSEPGRGTTFGIALPLEGKA